MQVRARASSSSSLRTSAKASLGSQEKESTQLPGKECVEATANLKSKLSESQCGGEADSRLRRKLSKSGEGISQRNYQGGRDFEARAFARAALPQSSLQRKRFSDNALRSAQPRKMSRRPQN